MGWTFKNQRTPPRGIETKAAPGDAVDFARERLGFEPDEQQVAVLRSPGKRVLLSCSRQWGKSTTAAIKVVHKAFTCKKSLILVLSPSLRQSGEFLMKVRDFVEALGLRPRSDRANRLSLVFPNGSRIVGLPGIGKIRSFSAVSMLLVEEAAEVKDKAYYTMRPALAKSDGDLWVIGTPDGKKGFFYEEWAYGGDRWLRLAVKGPDCSRLSKSFLEEERERRNDRWFRQEYLCEFLDQGESVFVKEMVEAAVDDNLSGLF